MEVWLEDETKKTLKLTSLYKTLGRLKRVNFLTSSGVNESDNNMSMLVNNRDHVV